MRKLIDNPVLILIIRSFIGVLFIFYGVAKIADPSQFANEIGNYGMTPDFITQLMALILPWAELIVGVLLLFGIYQNENGLIATAMLLMFTFAVIFAFASGLDINCGCSGGNAQQKVGWLKILENFGLIILTSVISLTNSNKFKLK
ncbi:MAG: MauE/DoxX family redox-associated membrane protein [Candidatus Kapaibacterium sp.]|nr:DoxX family membrane protein [Ignavibacteriota bacterium]MCB9220289.1 DoxX family membrane protein [Ignavibacteria bacterium]